MNNVFLFNINHIYTHLNITYITILYINTLT